MDTLKAIAENLRRGEVAKVAELVQKGMDDGLGWDVILNQGLFAGM